MALKKDANALDVAEGSFAGGKAEVVASGNGLDANENGEDVGAEDEAGEAVTREPKPENRGGGVGVCRRMGQRA